MLVTGIVTTVSGGQFLSPDSYSSGTALSERERGGIAISNPSQGINVNDWQCTYVPSTGAVVLKNLSTEVATTIINVLDIVDLSFAFDANMRPAIGYLLSDGVAKLYYYDSFLAAYSTITFPAGTAAPRLCHDDKRDTMVRANVTDILVFYIRADKLYYRLQRDRYVNEFPIATLTVGTVLEKVGMSNQLRLYFQIRGGSFVSSP